MKYPEADLNEGTCKQMNFDSLYNNIYNKIYPFDY